MLTGKLQCMLALPLGWESNWDHCPAVHGRSCALQQLNVLLSNTHSAICQLSTCWFPLVHMFMHSAFK